MVLKETTQTAWFKNSDWVVLKTEGLKKEEPKVEEPKVETVILDETNTTEIVESEEPKVEETEEDEVEALKSEIKELTGKRPKTKNIEKLKTQLNDLHNNGI
jgi:hypothetical protein